MTWTGEAHFGSRLIVFRGRSVENALHAMPVHVIAFSGVSRPIILDAQGRAVGGQVCLVRPMTPHIVAPGRRVTIAFLSPARWAFPNAAVRGEDNGFAQLEPAQFSDCLGGEVAEIARRIETLFGPDFTRLDARLQTALDLMGREPGAVSIGQAAGAIGISPSRLRFIAQRDLGSSLSRWLTWKKLEHAARDLADGQGLAQSAVSGGFADQPHLANAMRRMLGAAPSEIQPVRKCD